MDEEKMVEAFLAFNPLATEQQLTIYKMGWYAGASYQAGLAEEKFKQLSEQIRRESDDLRKSMP